MEKLEIWVGVLYNTKREWAQFDFAKVFYSKVEAEQWAQSVKKCCPSIFGGERIYIGKIPTIVDFLANEVKDGKEN